MNVLGSFILLTMFAIVYRVTSNARPGESTKINIKGFGFNFGIQHKNELESKKELDPNKVEIK